MVNHNARYSDLDEAIQLASRLTMKRSRARSGQPMVESASYVSFSMEDEDLEPPTLQRKPAVPVTSTAPDQPVHRAAATPAAPKERIGEPTVEPPDEPIETWDDFLKWSVKATFAQAGFVVDTQGFVIAQWGQIPSEGLDGLGAELCFAVEQLKRVSVKSERLSWIEMEYDKEHIVAIIEETIENGEFIVSYYSPPSGRQLPKKQLLQTLVAVKETLM